MLGLRPATIALLSAALLMCQPLLATPVVKDGKPVAGIFVDPRGAPTEQTAAVLQDAGKWLGECLDKATGTAPAQLTEAAGPRIVIARADQYPQIAADVKLDPGHQDGFCLVGNGDALYILGNTEVAARHGVAELLHELGFRFYNPMPRWHVIPALKDASFDRAIASVPTLRGRRIWYAYGVPDERLQGFYNRWSIANRLISAASVQTGHSWPKLIHDNLKEFEAHPEYFAMLKDGKRDTARTIEARKLCSSNPELVKLLVASQIRELEERRKANPYEYMVSMDPSDGPGTCECDNCKALGTPTDRVIHLANQVAKGVREKFPDAWVGLYAYSSHNMPPTIAVEPNIYVQVAMGFNNTPYELPELVSKWAEKVQAIGLREYYAVEAWDFGLPGRARGADEDYHRQWIPYYAERHLDAINAEAQANWGDQTLGFYVASRLMWDAGANVDAMVDEYFPLLFGNAAEPMRRLHEQFRESPRLSPVTLLPMFNELESAYQAADRQDVKDRLIDMMSYLHYVALYGKYAEAGQRDPKHGEVYYAALGDMMQYAFQTSDRGMVHTYALARRLCNGLPIKDNRPDFWMFLGSKKLTDDYLAKAGIQRESLPEKAVWMKGEPLTDAEIRTLFQQDLAELQAQAQAFPSFSEELVSVDIKAGDDVGPSIAIHRNDVPGLSRFSGKGQIHLLVSGPQVIPFKVAPERQRCTVAVTGPDGSKVYEMKFVRDAADPSKMTDMPISLPAAGLYRLVISGDSWLSIPPDAPMVYEASVAAPAQVASSGNHYFYVPKGTKQVRVKVESGRLGIAVPGAGGRNLVPSDQELAEPYLEVEVPAGADGQVWHTTTSTTGTFYLINVPPYLSFHRNSLLIPREIARKDGLIRD